MVLQKGKVDIRVDGAQQLVQLVAVALKGSDGRHVRISQRSVEFVWLGGGKSFGQGLPRLRLDLDVQFALLHQRDARFAIQGCQVQVDRRAVGALKTDPHFPPALNQHRIGAKTNRCVLEVETVGGGFPEAGLELFECRLGQKAVEGEHVAW